MSTTAAVCGIGVAIIVSTVMCPAAIAAYVGSGLATIGGRSIASGGFGMVGGAIVLSTLTAASEIATAVAVDSIIKEEDIPLEFDDEDFEFVELDQIKNAE